MFSVVLVLLNILPLFLYAKEDLQRTADKICRDALTEYSCVLTEREAEDAAVQLCRLEGLSVKSFEKTAASMEVLIKGLRAVVEQKRKPDDVYETLQLKKYNISPGNWSYYLKNIGLPRRSRGWKNGSRTTNKSLSDPWRKIIKNH